MANQELKLPGAVADIFHPNYVGPPYHPAVSMTLMEALNIVATTDKTVGPLEATIKEHGVSWSGPLYPGSAVLRSKVLSGSVDRKINDGLPYASFSLKVQLSEGGSLSVNCREQDPMVEPSLVDQTIVLPVNTGESAQHFLVTRDYSQESGWGQKRFKKGEINQTKASELICSIANTALRNLSDSAKI